MARFMSKTPLYNAPRDPSRAQPICFIYYQLLQALKKKKEKRKKKQGKGKENLNVDEDDSEGLKPIVIAEVRLYSISQ